MKHQGFVLMTITVILAVLTALVAADLRWLALDWKRHSAWYHYQQQLSDVEQVAARLGAKFSTIPGSDCRLTHLKQSATHALLLANGCKIAEHYRYGIRDLGLFPCVRLSKQLISHHWLLTVIDEQLPNQLFQYRIATPEPIQACHSGKVVYVALGPLTQYWL